MRGGGGEVVGPPGGAEKVEACCGELCFVVGLRSLSVMKPVCVVPASAAFSLTLQGAMADQPVPPAHSSCSLRLLKAQELSSNIALCGGKLRVRALRSFFPPPSLRSALSKTGVRGWLGCQARYKKQVARER